MSIEIGARIPGTNASTAATASRSQQNGLAEGRHDRPPPIQAGPLERLLDTPSPLDRLSETRK